MNSLGFYGTSPLSTASVLGNNNNSLDVQVKLLAAKVLEQQQLITAVVNENKELKKSLSSLEKEVVEAKSEISTIQSEMQDQNVTEKGKAKLPKELSVSNCCTCLIKIFNMLLYRLR